MRYVCLAAALLGLGATFARTGSSDRAILILTGDGRGSLGPCGCTKPMTGGLERLATVVKGYRGPRTALVANAAITGGLGKQEELKAQTFAAAMSDLGCDAIRLGDSERLVPEMRLAVENVDGESVLSDERPTVTKGPFVITSLTDPALLNSFARQDRLLVVLLDGDRHAAEALANQEPGIAVIQFREDGRGDSFKVGNTVLVSPGSKLRDVAIVSFEDGRPSVKIMPLTASISDDPQAHKTVDTYLQRISQLNLLAKLPRLDSMAFSGSQKCASCHAKAFKVWKHSGHGRALESLKEVRHDKDPECVVCHVTGITSTKGFVSALKTPQFAAVGCESCHGSAVEHSANPRAYRLPKVTEKICVTCHTTDQSPNFSFASKWKLIKH